MYRLFVIIFYICETLNGPLYMQWPWNLYWCFCSVFSSYLCEFVFISHEHLYQIFKSLTETSWRLIWFHTFTHTNAQYWSNSAQLSLINKRTPRRRSLLRCFSFKAQRISVVSFNNLSQMFLLKLFRKQVRV